MMTESQLQEARDFVAWLESLIVDSHQGRQYLVEPGGTGSLTENDLVDAILDAKDVASNLLAEVGRLRAAP